VIYRRYTLDTVSGSWITVQCRRLLLTTVDYRQYWLYGMCFWPIVVGSFPCLLCCPYFSRFSERYKYQLCPHSVFSCLLAVVVIRRFESFENFIVEVIESCEFVGDCWSYSGGYCCRIVPWLWKKVVCGFWKRILWILWILLKLFGEVLVKEEFVDLLLLAIAAVGFYCWLLFSCISGLGIPSILMKFLEVSPVCSIVS